MKAIKFVTYLGFWLITRILQTNILYYIESCVANPPTLNKGESLVYSYCIYCCESYWKYDRTKEMLTAKINDQKITFRWSNFLSTITLEFTRLVILNDIIRKKNAIDVKFFFVSWKTTMWAYESLFISNTHMSSSRNQAAL